MFKILSKVVKVLVFFDLSLLFGSGLVDPILAVFIVGSIKGGNIQVVGISVAIYWGIKSILMLPIAKYLDNTPGEKVDFYFLIFGTLLASFIPLGFIFANLPWHIYALEAIHAVGMAAVLPSWSGIFTRHIKEGTEAQSWTLDSSAYGIGTALAGFIGGTVAEKFGFVPLFIGVAVFGVISALSCLLIKKELMPKERRRTMIVSKP